MTTYKKTVPEREFDPMSVLSSTGEMGRLVLETNWTETPLGPMEDWPQSLRTTVSLCLASNFPINIAWGPQRIQIYNEGYRPICGGKHPRSLGQDFRECWYSAWPAIGEAFDRAIAGETSFLENQRMFLDRNGYLEETFFTFSFSPIRDETGGVGGLFHPVTEMTVQTLLERRLQVLRDLSDHTAEARTGEEVCARLMQSLAGHRLDIPFAFLYWLDVGGRIATLAGHTGMGPDIALCPAVVELGVASRLPWRLAEVADSGQIQQVDNLSSYLTSQARGPYSEPPASAMVLPVNLPGLERPFAILVAGVSVWRRLDAAYRNFYEMLGETVTRVLGNARAYEEERRRAEALAEIDLAKTTFFSNISHEFRTPLTLQKAPLEEILSDETLPAHHRESLDMIHRNTMRLLKLVNTLLDFSRIEAGRSEASFQATHLPEYTAELASWFRSAIENAGLRFTIDCPPLPDPVYVDRDHWEKIVLNLLSNAFKYTFTGEILLRIRHDADHVELSVSDTGVGIPEAEQSRVFERFHRVRGTQGRTHEGTGIGLSFVRELVRMHGGEVFVESQADAGTTFRVRIPRGKDHLSPEQIDQPKRSISTALGAEPFVEEALRWQTSLVQRGSSMDQNKSQAQYSLPQSTPQAVNPDMKGARILVVDDNADMGSYLGRILSKHYAVDIVPDGLAALAALQGDDYDLVLTDVMMPHLNGFGLLEAIREDGGKLPVMLLSARAGEESRIEGMEAGADDYLTKPFSAKELIARVEAQVKLYRLRQKAALRLEQLYEAERRAVQAREEMIAVVSHDLRNPLYTITTSLGLLRRPEAGSGKLDTQELLNVIDRSVHDMQWLVNEVLDVTRIDAGILQVAPGSILPEVLLDEAMKSLRVVVEKRGLLLKCKLEPGLPPVLADSDRILHVFQNLVENAAKFTSQGAITIGASHDPEGVCFAVRDTGQGIPQDQLPHLFERHWQAKHASRAGIGLGLTIVKGLVECHGGRVWVESIPGKGSAFFFILPLAEE